MRSAVTSIALEHMVCTKARRTECTKFAAVNRDRGGSVAQFGPENKR